MSSSVTQLTTRSQALMSCAFTVMAVMGFSPIVEVFSARWPLRFSELTWRYETLGTFLINVPPIIVLVGFMAILAVVTGSRAVVRATAIAFGALVLIQVIAAPLLLLDFFQVRRLIATTRAPGVKAVMIKTLLFAGLGIVGSAWAAVRAWQASEREGGSLRRKKGEGLVVGQPKGARPVTE